MYNVQILHTWLNIGLYERKIKKKNTMDWKWANIATKRKRDIQYSCIDSSNGNPSE